MPVKRILVQAGHMPPLEPGHLDQTGATGELELVTAIQRKLVGLLDADDAFHGVPMPGRIDRSVHVDAAVFLHADGATNTSARGFSVGFPLFDVNRRLAHLIVDEIEKIPGHPPRRPDNNTAGMADYYGYRRVETPGPEVLVEHGFVSNAGEHRWLTAHVSHLARAEHNALRRFYGLQATQTPVGGGSVHLGGGAGAHRITTSSALHSPPRAPASAAVSYLLGHAHGQYSDGAVRAIVDHYYDTADPVGLDPLLVIAQMAEETGHLTSFWSQPPRRNPAGIGVTGEPGVGLSFPDWATAVRAHTGRLLAYALPAGHGTAQQRALVAEALTVRPLPDHLRGAAPTLAGLTGTWARDPDYATKLASVANDIIAAGP